MKSRVFTDPELPRLAPPGAGLPRVERWIARLIFHTARRAGTLEKARATLARERDAVLGLTRGRDAEIAAKRVLIPRLPGLEDSSRHWSVFMTLDHLRIVNEAVAGVVGDLLDGRTPPGEASTAAVKPSANVDAGVVGEFIASCEKLERVVAGAGDDARRLATPLRFAHPWFGPLDAAGWFFMAGFHLRLHRKQIEHILARA